MGNTPTVQGVPIVAVSLTPMQAVDASLRQQDQTHYQRKPRTLLDPCPAPYNEPGWQRLRRYLLASAIVGAMVIGGLYLLVSYAAKEQDCKEMSDDQAACEASEHCAWYGDGGRESWTGMKKDSFSGERCARYNERKRHSDR
eukprot:CAMPEP_0117549642 /NCGR_PEP_ID=MMETSP0784-20121206/48270_1 /TAXON_ID=39447 /ORGANISM="" /LENGTH=141 /DNA_ID=CAMNT_0005346635 /DNA_START=105 /DNA_END=530 /DNA_ORIENTATION=+